MSFKENETRFEKKKVFTSTSGNLIALDLDQAWHIKSSSLSKETRLYVLDEQFNKIHLSITSESQSKELSRRSLAEINRLKRFSAPFKSCSIRDRCLVIDGLCIVEETHEEFSIL